jgi:hypothetical protein
MLAINYARHKDKPRTPLLSKVRVSFGCGALIQQLFLEVGVGFELALMA